MDEDPRLQQWVDRIDTELVRYFAKKDLSCNPLDRAMEYTLLAGGKRMRPLMSLVVCSCFGGEVADALPFSLAAEFLHTYSLIHDDLPCMDDDAMRRGKPANHIVFGEANAILAGDALQAEAFSVLANASHPDLPAERRIGMIAEFASAVGRTGMVAGQVMDLTAEGKVTDLERLELLHRRKTGSLIRFCVRLGAHLAAVDDAAMATLTTYADAVGLLFQVVDDLLDEEGNTERLGKTAGKDAHRGKATFPKLLGIEGTHQYADRLLAEAHQALNPFGDRVDLLRTLAVFIRNREH